MQGFLQSPIPYDNTNQNTQGVAGGGNPSEPFDPNNANSYNKGPMQTGAWFIPPMIDYSNPAHLAAVAATMGNYTGATVRGKPPEAAPQPAQNNFIDAVALTASRGKTNGNRP